MSLYENNRTKVLLACLHIYERDGMVTMRQVADGAGVSLACAHDHLKALRSDGLVTWEDGKHGTLRPIVEVVR